MYLTLVLAFVTLTYAGIPKDEDYRKMNDRAMYAPGAFRKWIDNHYEDLKRLKVPGLKPKEHYYQVEDRNKKWIEDRAKVRLIKLTDEIYERMDAKIVKPVGTYYYRKGKNKRTIYIIPIPHLAYPAEYPAVMRKFYDRFPDDHIVYLQSFRFLNSEKFRDENEIAAALRSELKSVNSTWKLEGTEKNFFVICNATPYVNAFFTKNPDLYDRVMYFSPMVSNIDKGRLFKFSELHPGEKTFDVLELFYLYFNILKDEKYISLYWSMKEYFTLNLPTYDYFMGLYDKGLDMSAIKPKYVIVGDQDPLVTPRNSRTEIFDGSHFIKGADHLTPFGSQFDELMDALDKFMQRKDKK